MRVAFVASEYPPYVYGGLGTHVEALTSALAARSVQVELFVPDRPGYVRPPAGVRLRPVPAGPVDTAEGNVGFWVGFCAGVVALVERSSIELDLIHCHDWLTALAGAGLRARRRIPLVFTVHLPQVGPPLTELEALGLASADLNVVNSQAMHRELRDRVPVPESLVVIPNGVDTERFVPGDPAASRAEVLFVGRLVPDKGVDVLLRSFAAVRARLPEARLVVAGGGDQDLYLRRLARYFGLPPQVDFVGWLTGSELVERYRRADVVAVPSRYEPFGLVALEAMACGRPVVASRTGGLAEIVDDGRTGLLVSPGDHLRLARALVKLLADDPARSSAGYAAREHVLRYTWDLVAEATLTRYANAVRVPVAAAEPPAPAVWALFTGLPTRARRLAAHVLLGAPEES